MKFVLVVVSAIAVFTADSRVYPENPDRGPNFINIVTPSPDGQGTDGFEFSDGFDDDLDERSLTDEAQGFPTEAEGIQESNGGSMILNGELVTPQEDQKIIKERKGLNKPEIRGKKQNNILKQIVKDLGYIKYNLTHADSYWKEELKSLKKNLNNVTNIGKEFKMELQSIRDHQYNLTNVGKGLKLDLQILKDYQSNSTEIGKDLRGDLQSVTGNITNSNSGIKKEVASLKLNIDSKSSLITSNLNIHLGDILRVLGCMTSQGEFVIGRQCFKMYTSRKNWASARSYCLSFGLDLAQPEHPSLVHGYFRQKGWTSYRTWIGAVGTGSCYQWLNGTCISQTSPLWGWGPNGDNGTSYAVDIHTSATPDKPLDADSTSNTHYCLCERK